jgi:hypothetical protein
MMTPPDLILIDGRMRVSCALESLLNLPEGSDCVLYLDDYESRPHYKAIEPFLRDAERIGRSLRFRKGSFDEIAGRKVLDMHYSDWR